MKLKKTLPNHFRMAPLTFELWNLKRMLPQRITPTKQSNAACWHIIWTLQRNKGWKKYRAGSAPHSKIGHSHNRKQTEVTIIIASRYHKKEIPPSPCRDAMVLLFQIFSTIKATCWGNLAILSPSMGTRSTGILPP